MYNKFTAVDGQGAALAERLLRAAELLADAPGCLLYIVNSSMENPDEVWVTEVWSDEPAHKASLGLEGVADLVAEVRPLIAGAPTQVRLQTLGGKGLR